MHIYPIGNSFYNNNCKTYTNSTTYAGNPKKGIKAIGDEFVKRAGTAKNREEFYSIATEYLKKGILPNLKDSDLRLEVVNYGFPEIELSFSPELIAMQQDIKHISLKAERKHFAEIVKCINKLTREWDKNK